MLPWATWMPMATSTVVGNCCTGLSSAGNTGNMSFV
jgi:hypothetical protein